jgi:hypothetical protein
MSAVSPAPPVTTDTKYMTGVLTSPPVVTLTAYIPTSVSNPLKTAALVTFRRPRAHHRRVSSSASHSSCDYDCYAQCVGGVIGRKGQKVEDLQRRAAKAATTRLPVRVSVV